VLIVDVVIRILIRKSLKNILEIWQAVIVVIQGFVQEYLTNVVLPALEDVFPNRKSNAINHIVHPSHFSLII